MTQLERRRSTRLSGRPDQTAGLHRSRDPTAETSQIEYPMAAAQRQIAGMPSEGKSLTMHRNTGGRDRAAARVDLDEGRGV